MNPSPKFRAPLLLSLAAFAMQNGSTPCHASPLYSLTDLGPELHGFRIFDDQGRVEPDAQYSKQTIHGRAGIYSIEFRYTQPASVLQSFALTEGQGPVQIRPGPGMLFEQTYAYAVNRSGTFVGAATNNAYTNAPMGAAFLYTQAGGTQAVPTPYAYAPTVAYSINDAGLIVGSTGTYGDDLYHFLNRAFLSAGPSSWDLNTLIAPGGDFLLTSATDINDSGQIVGSALDTRDGTVHNYLLTPTATPEPPSIVMASLGGLAVGLARWAGRRAK